jgi:spore coat protein H
LKQRNVICAGAPALLSSPTVKLTTTGTVFLLFLALHGPGRPAVLTEAQAAEDRARVIELGKADEALPGSEIFDRPTILNFQVQLVETNLQALRDHPREYTPATVLVNGEVYRNVGVKLKGAAGSFRHVDDHPAMTLHFSKWSKDQRVFGLRRLHLNNSVQDDSRMNEYLASGLFRSAGVPTPRVAWATVRINERKLGLYVLKEAFETEFLRIYFGSDKGNLYEGGFLRDIDHDPVKESGKGPDDGSDMRALCEAMREKNTTNRWEKLSRLLDVDKFVTYAAISVMLADWDGYPLNRNNYRVYFRPRDGRAVFMPHGMDQLFQRSDMEMDASWGGTMAWALFDTPPGFKLYEERCRQIFTNVFKLEQMTNTIAQLTEVLKKADPHIVDSANDLSYQVERRFRSLRRDQFLNPPRPAMEKETPITTPTQTEK